jgi:hypothetical protein
MSLYDSGCAYGSNSVVFDDLTTESTPNIALGIHGFHHNTAVGSGHSLRAPTYVAEDFKTDQGSLNELFKANMLLTERVHFLEQQAFEMSAKFDLLIEDLYQPDGPMMHIAEKHFVLSAGDDSSNE